MTRRILISTLLCLYIVPRSCLFGQSRLEWVREGFDISYEAIAFDSDNNVVVGTQFGSIVDFDQDGTRDTDGSSLGVVIFDSDGNLLELRPLADAVEGSSEINDVGVEPNGNVVIAGSFGGKLDLDLDEIADAEVIGSNSFYVAKYAPDGTLIWGRTGGQASGEAVAVDEVGNVYVAGGTWDLVDFNGDGSPNAGLEGRGLLFLAKYDSDGGFQWVMSADSDWADGTDVALFGSDYVYFTGLFKTQADLTADGIPDVEGAGMYNGLLAVYDKQGPLQWAVSMGDTEPLALAIDENGQAYVTGYHIRDADLDEDGQIELDGPDNPEDHAFLAVYDKDGVFQWAQGVSEAHGSNGIGVAVHPSGSVFVGGRFGGEADFDGDTVGDATATPPLDPEDLSTGANPWDLFVASYDCADADLTWLETPGGWHWDRMSAFGADSEGNVYIGGEVEAEMDFNDDDEADVAPVDVGGWFKKPEYLAKYNWFGLAVAAEDQPVPDSGTMMTLWPNPASDRSLLQVSLERDSELEIELLDVLGRRVRAIHRGRIAAGSHRLALNTADLPQGLYWILARGGDLNVTEALSVVR